MYITSAGGQQKDVDQGKQKIPNASMHDEFFRGLSFFMVRDGREGFRMVCCTEK